MLHNGSYTYAFFFWILSYVKIKFDQILVWCMTNISNMLLAQCWRLERFLKIIAPAYIYKLTKFGALMSCSSKDFFKKTYLVSCTNNHHDVTDLENCEMVIKTKTWISWERDITFLQNKKIVNLYLRWYILRRYHFVADVIFNLHMSILYKRKSLC